MERPADSVRSDALQAGRRGALPVIRRNERGLRGWPMARGRPRCADNQQTTRRLPVDADSTGGTTKVRTLHGPPARSALDLRDVTMRNRIAISPMCQYSAIDGMASDYHFAHLARFAMGGAGLVMVEATAVTAQGRITHGCLA